MTKSLEDPPFLCDPIDQGYPPQSYTPTSDDTAPNLKPVAETTYRFEQGRDAESWLALEICRMIKLSNNWPVSEHLCWFKVIEYGAWACFDVSDKGEEEAKPTPYVSLEKWDSGRETRIATMVGSPLQEPTIIEEDVYDGAPSLADDDASVVFDDDADPTSDFPYDVASQASDYGDPSIIESNDSAYLSAWSPWAIIDSVSIYAPSPVVSVPFPKAPPFELTAVDDGLEAVQPHFTKAIASYHVPVTDDEMEIIPQTPSTAAFLSPPCFPAPTLSLQPANLEEATSSAVLYPPETIPSEPIAPSLHSVEEPEVPSQVSELLLTPPSSFLPIIDDVVISPANPTVTGSSCVSYTTPYATEGGSYPPTPAVHNLGLLSSSSRSGALHISGDSTTSLPQFDMPHGHNNAETSHAICPPSLPTASLPRGTKRSMEVATDLEDVQGQTGSHSRPLKKHKDEELQPSGSGQRTHTRKRIKRYAGQTMVMAKSGSQWCLRPTDHGEERQLPAK